MIQMPRHARCIRDENRGKRRRAADQGRNHARTMAVADPNITPAPVKPGHAKGEKYAFSCKVLAISACIEARAGPMRPSAMGTVRTAAFQFFGQSGNYVCIPLLPSDVPCPGHLWQ